VKRLATQSLVLHCQPCDLSVIFVGLAFSTPCDVVRQFPGPALSRSRVATSVMWKNGTGSGTNRPLPIRLGIWGSVVSSPSEVRGIARKIFISRLFPVSKTRRLCCYFAKFFTFSQLEKLSFSFYQRSSIVSYSSAGTARAPMSVPLSVRPSVRLSHS